MGCFGQREKLGNLRAEQKWDYINLSDFKSRNCWTPLSYGVLYISLLISIGVYAVDLFTAINLLVFDRWSGQVAPVIPFTISRWIFLGCIVLSYILLVFRWIRAVRSMRSGGVAQSYLDPLAVRIQSIRMGQRGRGWRRFLVFAELTKNRKGTEYVALFTYFSFEAWLRIVFAEGPQKVINALTLYSVLQLKLEPNGSNGPSNGNSAVVQFFVNVKILANSNREQATVLFGMLFTLVIWIFAAISLLIACILYIVFLWHHIPTADGGLSGYCRRKVDKRVSKIVGETVKKAIAQEDMARSKGDAKAFKAGERPQVQRKPTLPVLDTAGDDKLMEMPRVSRQPTSSTLQSSKSAPGQDATNPVQRQPTLPDILPQSARPPYPSRSATQSSAQSNASYASNAPLVGAANPMGYGPPGRSYSPGPLSRMDSDRSFHSDKPLLSRNPTAGSQSSYTPTMRPPPSQGRGTPRPPIRVNTGLSNYSSTSRLTPFDVTSRRTPGPQFDRYDPSNPRSQTPGQAFELRSQTSATGRPTPSSVSAEAVSGGYKAFNPDLSVRPSPAATARVIPSPPGPQRNITTPGQMVSPNDYFNYEPVPRGRTATAPLPQAAEFGDVRHDGREQNGWRTGPVRSATARPGGAGWRSGRGGVAPGSAY